MATLMLHEKTVKNATAVDGKRTVIWDSAISMDASLPGSFGVRITSTGVKSWIIMYRIENPKHPGKMKQYYRKIGTYPALSLSAARDLAREALKMVGRGVDPVEAREEVKMAVAAVKTVEEAIDTFISRYAKQKNRSWQEVDRVFRVYIKPKLGGRPLPSIEPGDIHDILDRLMDSGHPYMANRVFAHVRKFFNWCAERHWIDEPPTKNMSRPAIEVSRERVLSNEELLALWNACDDIGWPFGPFYRILLLTAQRRSEVASMKWEQIDFDKAVWTMPPESTKSKRTHDVPLSRSVVNILNGLPRGGPFVFSTTGKTPISGFSKVKGKIDALIAASQSKYSSLNTPSAQNLGPDAMPEWRNHDIRRTAASGMAEIGIAPHVIEKVLNHATGQISGVAAVYKRHSYNREKAEALNAWAQALETIVGIGNDNVITLQTTKS